MDEEILKSTTIFKALSNATRIEILMLLARNKQLIVQDFVKELNLAQSTVSAHLSVLKNAGLIKSEIQATKTIYTLKQKNIEKAEKEEDIRKDKEKAEKKRKKEEEKKMKARADKKSKKTKSDEDKILDE